MSSRCRAGLTTMTDTQHEGRIDRRYSDPDRPPSSWQDAERALAGAELYWCSSVRADGRPHVTPMVGVWHEGGFHFSTAAREQKWKNLDANDHIAVTTGTNTWDRGLDVVLEGRVRRVTERAELQRVADAYAVKYGERWAFQVLEDGFDQGDGTVTDVFRVVADKVIAFAKEPHGQTTFRFG
jgi:nitroimidazol reductase NimA-like FMN-containing flavoprotein (pyridoxamine 5'-phosphate oxidase superfamily)